VLPEPSPKLHVLKAVDKLAVKLTCPEAPIE